MKNLILLHGALGAASLFDHLTATLSDYECHTFNFSGHGKAAFANSGFGIEQFANELEAFIRENQLEGSPVFGYSMGGYVALYLETLNPGTFSKIVTLGTKFDWQPDAAQHEASRMVPGVIKEKVPHFAAMLEERHGAQWEQLMEATAQMMIGLGNQPLLKAENLALINTPATIMLGDKDHMVSLEESQLLASYLSHGSYQHLENTPHPLEKVDPVRLSSVLKSLF